MDYEVATPGRKQEKKVYHINFLKPPSDPAVPNPWPNLLSSGSWYELEPGNLFLWNLEIQTVQVDDSIETPGVDTTSTSGVGRSFGMGGLHEKY